ncbi:MAG: hypothetical protein VX768_21750 [Planctomycetota bacterium]|nr:hypothetical protein [Planctomycetota bacterium]
MIDKRQPEQSPRDTHFSTRAVKLRIFALVCGVMIVLVLMFEAGKPDNWEWMGFPDAEPAIDTRYLSNVYPVSRDQQKSNPGGEEIFREPGGSDPEKSDPAKKEPAPEPVDGESKVSPDDPFLQPGYVVAEKTFWDASYKKLNYRQRMLLLEGLYRARRGGELAEQKASEWLRISEEISNANDRYQGDIVQFMTTLGESDPERGQLSQTLFQLQNRWTRFHRILLAIGNPESGEPIDATELDNLQQVVDRTAFGFVEDNALQSFVNDQPAMFRLIERVQVEKPGAVSSGGTAETVQFAQLYKETDRLRGEKVTFEGEIRAAYWFQPTPNFLGVDRLYAFWIQIVGAQNPVAVYSLSVPGGFVANLDDHDQSNPVELREKVRITGLLFQKMVYAAEDGQRIAPVVFTDQFLWQAEEPEKGNASGELPGMTILFGSFLGFGAILALITWGVVSFNNSNHARRISDLKKRFEEEQEGADVDAKP